MYKKIGIGLVALIVLATLVGYLLPSAYHVERSTEIQAPDSLVFSKVADLKQWQQWSPWQQADPKMQINYSPSTTGIGAYQQWVSESQGSGKLTYTQVLNNQSVSYELQFVDWEGTSTGSFSLQKTNNGTKITWSMDGDMGSNPFARYFCLFMNGMIGKDFEKGLANLKAITEKNS